MVTGEEFAHMLSVNAQSHDLLQRLMVKSETPLKTAKYAQSYSFPKALLDAGTVTPSQALTEAAAALITLPERMFFGNHRNPAAASSDITGLWALIDSKLPSSAVVGTAVYEYIEKAPNKAWAVTRASADSLRSQGNVGAFNGTQVYSENYRPQVLRPLHSDSAVFMVLNKDKNSYWVSDVLYDKQRNMLYREYQLPGM
jgi:hypothetical protein